MRAVYINLDRAEQRRAFMERQFAAMGIALQRFSAISAETLSDERLAREGRSWERPLSRAELACYLSHDALWRQTARGHEPVLILEDDIILSPRLKPLLPKLAAVDGVEMLNLESFGKRRFVARRSRPIGEGGSIRRVHRDKAGAAAYLLWPAGAEKLVARSARGAAPADALLHGLRGLASFQVEPALAVQAHILAGRGLSVPIAVASSVQAPRAKLAVTPANAPFHARRIATQLRLAGDHAMRLFGRRYRRVKVDWAEFSADDQSCP